jgi:glycerol uptake facilitator protein
MVIIAKSAGVSLAVLSARNDPAATGSLLTGGLSAGLGVMVGILVTGNASGAHMNPCVSVAMAIWGRLKFSALPSYICGQFLGAAAGSALVLFLFYDTIVEVGPEVMTSYPGLAEGEVQLSFDQGVATFILLLVVCSVEDQGHTPPALLVGLSVATITITMGANAGASMNPAVDFMPR